MAHAKLRLFPPGYSLLGFALVVLLLASVAEAAKSGREQADPAGSGASPDAAESTQSEDEASEEEKAREERRQQRIRLERSQEGDPTNVETPIFPEARYRDAMRIRFTTLFLPGASFDTYKTDLFHPSFRARFTIPMPSKRTVLQLTARGALSEYAFSSTAPVALQSRDTLYSSSLVLQGAHQLNDPETWWWFTQGETWSILANAYARSRFESGAFSEGLTYGGVLALGYQSTKWRVAAGLHLASPLTGSEVKVFFIGTLRWDPTRKLTIRNRELGAQVEYRLSSRLKLFLSGYQTRQRYRLDVPGEVALQDKAMLVGSGFEWKISRYFRLLVEGGVVPYRNLRIEEDGALPITDEDAEPGGYLDVRLEIRP